MVSALLANCLLSGIFVCKETNKGPNYGDFLPF